METGTVPDLHSCPAAGPHRLWSTRYTPIVPLYVYFASSEAGNVMLTTPALATALNPFGSGGAVPSVIRTVGVPPGMPPAYVRLVTHPFVADPEQVALLTVKWMCAKTSYATGTKSDAPKESVTLTPNL